MASLGPEIDEGLLLLSDKKEMNSRIKEIRNDPEKCPFFYSPEVLCEHPHRTSEGFCEKCNLDLTPFVEITVKGYNKADKTCLPQAIRDLGRDNGLIYLRGFDVKPDECRVVFMIKDFYKKV